ncbi:MAG: hypothetical protein WC682_05390 [Parcubacteria group bacterium]|jgi:hypothetical protein
MIKQETKNKIAALVVFVVVIAITVLIIQLIGIGVDFLRKKWGLENATVQSDQPITQPSSKNSSNDTVLNNVVPEKASSDFDKFNSYKKFDVYPDGIVTPLNFVNNAEKDLKNAGRKIKISGKIEDAYVYIRAGANDQNGKFTSIMRQYDSIWFYISNGHFLGGQLDVGQSIFGGTSELTDLLFNLKSVPVADDLMQYKKGFFKSENLLSELNGERTIGSLVSTVRYGRIDVLEIGYKCVENSDCNIELVN